MTPKYKLTNDGLSWKVTRTEIKPVKNRETGVEAEKEVTSTVGYYNRLDQAGLAVYEDFLKSNKPDINDLGLLNLLLKDSRKLAVLAVREATEK